MVRKGFRTRPMNRRLAKELVRLANYARSDGRVSRIEQRFTISIEKRFPLRTVEVVTAIDGRELNPPIALAAPPKKAPEFSPLLD